MDNYESTSSARFSIDGINKLSVEDLSSFIAAINSQYKRFLKKQNIYIEDDIEKSLFVKEIRTGSLIIELISGMAPLVPLLPEAFKHIDKINAYLEYLTAIINTVKDGQPTPSQSLISADYSDIYGLLSPVANNKDSTIAVTNNYADGGVINNIFINSSDARKIQRNATKYLEQIVPPKIMEKVILKWHQARFDQNTTSGDRAIIDKIEPTKPLKVIFQNDDDKRGMLKKDDRFDKPWHELCYLVDVEVDIDALKNKPRSYKIIRFYPEDTFEE